MTELHIKPVGYRVLIKADDIERATASGIIFVLDEKLERAGQMRGTVVAKGDLAWSWCDKPWAEVGDKVIYARYSGALLEDPVTKEDYYIMNDEDIVAVFPKSE